MKKHVIFKPYDDYFTPVEVVRHFGIFDYDPATIPEQAKRLGIPEYDTIETDGLKRDWTQFDRIWINPPFTIKHLFFKKAVETFEKAGNDIFILLPIEFLTTNRFHNFKKKGILYIPKGRIKFERPFGSVKKSPAFGSVIYKPDYEDAVKYISEWTPWRPACAY